jgi:hypothetical protein
VRLEEVRALGLNRRSHRLRPQVDFISDDKNGCGAVEGHVTASRSGASRSVASRKRRGNEGQPRGADGLEGLQAAGVENDDNGVGSLELCGCLLAVS